MAWLLAVEGALILGDFVYHRWIEDKPPPLKPSSLSVPSTAEGSVIPLLYGTCRVRSPVLAWVGNWFAEQIGSDPIDHFIYFLNSLWVVGAPFNLGTASLASIFVANRKIGMLTRSAPTDSPAAYDRAGRTRYLVNGESSFFGGAGTGGILEGEIAFYDGRPDQRVSDGVNHGDFRLDRTEIQAYLTGDRPAAGIPNQQYSSIDASLIPGYRGLALCFLFEWGGAESPTTTSVSFEVTALSTGSASDLGHSLSLDADPAAVIYDLLTSGWGKLSLPTSKIDLTSFQAASATLFSEGHGYSRAIEDADDAITIINDVLHQIDGVLYEEPTTGRIELHLVRPDYTVAGLTDINPDNARLTNYQVQGWSETINQIRLTFTSRQNNYADGQVIAQNPANVVYQGGKLRSSEMRFVGCSTPELAQKLASRELAAVSAPLTKATVVVNRSFYQARPGSVYTLTWPKLGIDHMVMRVARVNLGQLHQGEITLDLMRDIFAASLGAFPSPA